MKTSIEVYDQTTHKHIKILTRTVFYHVIQEGRLPRCAWCRLNDLRPLTDIIQRGFTMDLVETIGYCDTCHKGTIVKYEIDHGSESEVK